MFRPLSSVGLRSRLLLVGLAVLVPLVAVMLQLAQYERDNALANAEERIGLFASLSADRQSRLMHQTQLALRQIASDWRARAHGEDCNAFLAKALASHQQLAGLRVSALNGTAICADGPEVMESDVSDRRYFRAALAGQAFAVSGQLITLGAGNPIVVAAVPVREGDRVTGVISAAMELSRLGDVLPAELTNDPDLVITVLDSNGFLLARRPHDPELVGRPFRDRSVVQWALRVPSGPIEAPDLKGNQRLFAFRRIDTVDWVVAVGISRASVLDPIDAALHRRLALIAAIVLSSCIIGLIGAEAFVFWPLRALARTAQELERGNLAARPRLTGVSEVGTLEHSLYRMAEAIQQRETDLKASQAALEQAVNDTRRANDAKSQFLASMSHEIRTPFSGIVGYNDLLLAEDLSPKQRQYAERIRAAAAAVITVIDGVLDIARMEAGEVEIEKQPFSLHALVDNAISIVRPNAERKNIELAVELDPELPAAVVGDEARLRQVLLNLLTNAVKFTSRGSVTLRVHRARSKGRIRFAIIDTGIGIAEEQHHRVFKRFSQVHDPNRREYGGTGLGLAISKELVGLMGGQLGFTSKQGQGSTFWVELELPQADGSTPQLRSIPVQSSKTGRILVADDYEMNREITTTMLTMAGHEVDAVGDGAEAVEAVRSKTYDVVLMDIEMRGMNGISAVRQIRQLDSPSRNIPVVALTANVLPQQVRAFKEAGMDDHLGKPFTRNQLLDKVNFFLSPDRSSAGKPASLSSSRAAAYDKKALEEMKKLIGEQRTAAWLGMLRAQLETIIAIDRRPISRRQLATSAHSLVSQAGSLGFSRLSKLSSELEEACLERTDYTAALGRVRKAAMAALSRIDQIQKGRHQAAPRMEAEQK